MGISNTTIKLGIETAITGKFRRVWHKKRAQRWQAVTNRVTKLQSYKVSGALRLGAIYATGPIAAIAYGAEVNGIPPAKLKAMRVQKLKLMGKYTQGVPIEQQYLLLPPSDDTVLAIQMAPLFRYHREVWAAGDPQYAVKDTLTVPELCQE